MTLQRPTKLAAASLQVCPHIGNHAGDIIQPPGIGIPSMEAIDAHPRIVAVVLAAKINAAVPRKTG
ncbi:MULTISPECIES: hypothetical protein [unclassified Chelatococcus]|uniref:hypothetical protein n=1 Tax=unclassified Chelatococcus TaxID=2638111 RepID=UPI001BCE199A|nr:MULTISPECIES: hypothetical protein [unclassified Chelatococcus]CAH1672996.1 hypothetical protein CHELA20_51002 [Hyphomicrobiales bacterium]MBS7738880.1 hypothetical protein [Chelatococcus sp. HY11]MBX3547032.1 hypothetical protein [Chelatococcus sp.]MCO5076592.1 hypothetical protein [Chelatococcus sp.]CAH1674764.1 hypothetical protein CHELA41_24011 [Hyphomicrobiales bacterium]